MNGRTYFQLFSAAIRVLPIITILGSFGILAIYTGNGWPWLEVVHESGDRTLLDTVLYYQHATRELPLDILLGAAIGGGVLWVFPVTSTTSPNRMVLLSSGVLIVIGVIVAGTLWTGGPAMLWDNFFQMYTRPGEPASFGSHWRYHLLSRLSLILGSFGLAGLIVVWLRGRQGSGGISGQRVFFRTVLLFFALTIVFIPDFDPFSNPVFFGHQVREVFTHALVTVPLGWWFCLLLSAGNGQGSERDSVSVGWPLSVGSGAVLLGFYLLIGALCTSAGSMGQTDSVVLLLWPHFFEHTFSFIVVPLVAGLIYESGVHLKRVQNHHIA